MEMDRGIRLILRLREKINSEIPDINLISEKQINLGNKLWP